METGGMNGVRLLLGILGATLLTVGAATAQPLELPAGPNRDLVSRRCQACHDLAMVFAAAGLNREGWDLTIDEMMSFGMEVTPEDRAKIVDYLSGFLGSASAPSPGAPAPR
jgi:cytochrome c5